VPLSREKSIADLRFPDAADELDIIDVGDVSWKVEDVVKEEEEEAESDDDSEAEPVVVSSPESKARSTSSPVPTSRRTPFVIRLLYAFIILATSGAIINFKIESAPIGYCDMGKNTNGALESLKRRLDAIEECNKENRTVLYATPLRGKGVADPTPCPPLSLIPLPHPSSCTPCPDHGNCTQHSVTCNTGYLLRPHPLLFFLPSPPPTLSNTTLHPLEFSSPSDLVWKVVSEVTDGLPGLGSVALPPRCVEDPRRKRNIGVLGKVIEKMLGRERGKRLCVDGNPAIVSEAEGGDAKRWGLDVEKLRESLKTKISVRINLHVPHGCSV
jgi:hypothetical protein